MDKFIDQCENFTFELINWYKDNHRKLPWRETKDPYKIWLSEIILQQTRVVQGMSYYEKFTSKYPKVEDLAAASEQEVLKDWQGLGYYSRARNLHSSAKMIVEEYDGNFPNQYEKIRELKGVGDYTAAAIASFAFDKDHAVVDGNVYRLLSRFFGIETPIDSSMGKKEFFKLANLLIPSDQAAIYNQAIMEFGAIQCKAVNPDCMKCPLQSSCYAYANDQINQLPIKEKKTKVRDRFLNYFIVETDEKILLNERSQKGIWQNLFDFPCIEQNSLVELHNLQNEKAFKDLFKDLDFDLEVESEERKHILSHQRLHCKFYHLKTTKISSNLERKFTTIDKTKLADYPIPKLVENYLREETNLLSLFRI